MSIRDIGAVTYNCILRLLFCHRPRYLYHYSRLNSSQINSGFLFKVNTQGRMYALDLDFGQSSVLNNSSVSVIVFSGKAVDSFVRHNLFYIFGFKFFWGHYMTPRMGDVQFTSVKHHPGGIVEVEDFRIVGLSSISQASQRFKVAGFALLYAAVLLLFGPVFALFMRYVFGSQVLSGECFSQIVSQWRSVLWPVVAVVSGLSFVSWLREYLNVARFKGSLLAAGLMSRLPFVGRASIALWASFSTALWILFIFALVFVPSLWVGTFFSE